MCIKMAKNENKLTVPEGIKVSKDKIQITFSGEGGTIKRKFDYPGIEIQVSPNEIVLSSKTVSKKSKTVINSYVAHIKNAFKGARQPYIYTMKICSGHFPMNVAVSDNFLIIKNFLGEKIPRKVKIKEGVKVKVDGNLITVEGPDKELSGQVAADIEQATRRAGFDRRIFQDGIYLIEKAGKKI
jgi:large subunit ribosomal protein L6